MKMIFMDGDNSLAVTEIEPQEDTMLPPVAMVGQYAFLFHELAWSKEAQMWCAVYMATQPLILPASQAVNSHFMLRRTIKGND